MIVTQEQIVAAMQFHEQRHVAANGPLDRIGLPAAVSKLADLLGTMWYAREPQAQVSDTSAIATLLREALVIGAAGEGVSDPRTATASQPPQVQSAEDLSADILPLPACPLRDNGDSTCEACQ